MWLTGNYPENPVANFYSSYLLNKKEMIKIFCVYKITNLINGKLYIGITKRDPQIRFNEHFSNKEELLYKAKEIYGKENKYRSIAYCLSGKIKTSQGYFWKYEE